MKEGKEGSNNISTALQKIQGDFFKVQAQEMARALFELGRALYFRLESDRFPTAKDVITSLKQMEKIGFEDLVAEIENYRDDLAENRELSVYHHAEYLFPLLILFYHAFKEFADDLPVSSKLFIGLAKASHALTSDSYWYAGFITRDAEISRKNTIGAAAMKERGKRSEEAVRQVIEQFGISSLDFRGNKRLRHDFWETARNKTAFYHEPSESEIPLSDDRIRKIAKNVLEDNRLKTRKKI